MILINKETKLITSFSPPRTLLNENTLIRQTSLNASSRLVCEVLKPVRVRVGFMRARVGCGGAYGHTPWAPCAPDEGGGSHVVDPPSHYYRHAITPSSTTVTPTLRHPHPPPSPPAMPYLVDRQIHCLPERERPRSGGAYAGAHGGAMAPYLHALRTRRCESGGRYFGHQPRWVQAHLQNFGTAARSFNQESLEITGSATTISR